MRELNALKHTPRRSFAPIALALVAVRLVVVRALAHNAYVVVEQARAFIVVVVVVVSNAVHRLDREREVNVIDVRGG